MKVAQYFASFALMAVALSVSAFAKDAHAGNFTLSDTVQVGSTQLAPGSYKAEWNGPANDVKINITKDGKAIATTEGKIKDLRHPAPYDAVVLKTIGNDTQAIDEIDFDNRTEALVLGSK